MASAFMNSIKAAFSPAKTGETMKAKKGNVGSKHTPTRKTDSHRLKLGAKV